MATLNNDTCVYCYATSSKQTLQQAQQMAIIQKDFQILMSVICLLHSYNVKSTLISLIKEENNYNNCAWSIIKYNIQKDITLVNIKDDGFIKDVHLLNIKTLIRSFLAMEVNEPNEAYALQCDELAECKNGLDDLVKDRYWNPNAIFVIKASNFQSQDEELLFQKLHSLYVFKTMLVVNKSVYVYDFEKADHCSFTAKAITDYSCENLTSDNTSGWVDIRGCLEERPKPPYSECNISVVVIISEPYVFPPTGGDPVGYEEEFIAVLKIMNFTKVKIIYNTKNIITGVVCENFTVSGILRDLQNGVVDYVVGATVLSHYRLHLFDFTYPHWCDHFLLMVPKAKQIDKWVIMYTVFKPNVWGLIFIAFVCVTLVAFAIKVNGERDIRVLVLTTLDMYSYFTSNASFKSPSYFLLSWALFAWLITCFYQSDLSSIFTKPAYYREIDSLKEVVDRNYTFHLVTPMYNRMKASKEVDMDGLVQKSVTCNNAYECLRVVAYERRKFTLSSRLSYFYFEPEFDNKDGEAMLHRIAEPYSYFFLTGYLRKGNPNLNRIRFLEQQIITAGFNRKSLLTLIHMNKLKHHKMKQNLSKALSCQDIAGLYYILMCGCGLSLVVFCIEVVLNK